MKNKFNQELQLSLATGEKVVSNDMFVVFRYSGPGNSFPQNDSLGPRGELSAWDVSTANIIITIFASLIIFCTVVGNFFVIAAVMKERRLRKVSNSFVINLAVSDILVGTLVTPIALLYQLHDAWVFSKVLCDFWISVDVTCCTASITNLCVISYDRYNAITQPLKYARKRTVKRALILILVVWTYSLGIAIPPFFGWRVEESESTMTQCKISQDIGYTFYSTIGAFYLPLLFMLFAYICIYRETSKRTRQWRRGPGSSKMISERDSNQEVMNIHMIALAKESDKASPTLQHDSAVPNSPSTGSQRRGSCSGYFLRGSSLLQRHSLPYESAIVEVDETTRKDGSSSSGSSTNNAAANVFQTTALTHLTQQSLPPSEQTETFMSEEDMPLRKRYPFPRKLIRQISNLPSSDSSTATSSSTNTTSSSDLPPDQQGSDRRMSSVLVRQNTLMTMNERKESLARALQEIVEPPGSGGSKQREFRKSVTFLTPPSITSTERSSQVKDISPSDPSQFTAVDLLGQTVKGESRTVTRGNRHPKKRISVSQEKRAAKTLSIVMGCFIVCWLPFFIVALLEPLCRECFFHPALIGVVLWMGYCNSALNPIIYTFFNKDFRFAFKKMVTCSRRRRPTLL